MQGLKKLFFSRAIHKRQASVKLLRTVEKLLLDFQTRLRKNGLTQLHKLKFQYK